MIKNRTNPWEDRYGIEINDLLALTEIVEDFPEFSKSLKSYLKYHPTDKDLQKLQIACFGESTWSLAANKFYRQNQQTVERLNQYSTVATFRKNIMTEKEILKVIQWNLLTLWDFIIIY